MGPFSDPRVPRPAPWRICSCATTNEHLRRWIYGNGTLGGLSDCFSGRCQSDTHAVVDGSEFADYVHRVVSENYRPSEDGEAIDSLIQRIAGVSNAIARRIVSELRGREGVSGSRLYDGTRLELVGRWGHVYYELWRSFIDSVKHKERFMGTARDRMSTFLKDIESLCSGRAVVQLDSATKVFRARLARSGDEARKWHEKPKGSLCAPSQARARAGRMNAAGIRVFYGALKEEIALAEVRPSVGCFVVLGTFRPTRSLKVVDLGRLHLPQEEDVFRTLP